jgi:hypothetical protein
MMDNNDVITLNEAAALLRVHPVTLRKRAVAWGVPHRRLGAEWRFSRMVLAAWIQRREEDAALELVSTIGSASNQALTLEVV